MIKRTLAALATAAVAISLSACTADGPANPEPTASEQTTTLKLASLGLPDLGGVLLGIEQGIFAKHGIELELSTIPDPPSGLAAVQSGQVDIVYAPVVALLNALSQGVPVQIVGPSSGPPPDAPEFFGDTVVVAPDSSIESVADLEGKTVSVPARKANAEIAITEAMLAAGADPAAVNWVVLDFASALQSLRDASIDAVTLLGPTFTAAQAEGFRPVFSGTVNLLGRGTAGAYWVTGAQTAQNKPEALAAFQDALLEANAYANANVEAALTLGLEGTGLSPDQVEVIYWPDTLSVDDVKTLSSKLVALGFLGKDVDLSHAVFGS